MIDQRGILFNGTGPHRFNEHELIDEQIVLEFMAWRSVNDDLAAESMALSNHLQQVEFKVLAVGAAEMGVVNANKEHHNLWYTAPNLLLKLAPGSNDARSGSSCINDDILRVLVTQQSLRKLVDEWIDHGMRFTNKQPTTSVQTRSAKRLRSQTVDFDCLCDVADLSRCLNIAGGFSSFLERVCYAHHESTPT